MQRTMFWNPFQNLLGCDIKVAVKITLKSYLARKLLIVVASGWGNDVVYPAPLGRPLLVKMTFNPRRFLVEQNPILNNSCGKIMFFIFLYLSVSTPFKSLFWNKMFLFVAFEVVFFFLHSLCVSLSTICFHFVWICWKQTWMKRISVPEVEKNLETRHWTECSIDQRSGRRRPKELKNKSQNIRIRVKHSCEPH